MGLDYVICYGVVIAVLAVLWWLHRRSGREARILEKRYVEFKKHKEKWDAGDED